MAEREATAAEKVLRVRRGVTYRRTWRYTRRDATTGVQVDLDAADWDATLAITPLTPGAAPVLELTSDPAAGITLTTVDGPDDGMHSIDVAAVIDSETTAEMDVTTKLHHTLVLVEIGTDPPNVVELISDAATVVDTALDG